MKRSSSVFDLFSGIGSFLLERKSLLAPSESTPEADYPVSKRKRTVAVPVVRSPETPAKRGEKGDTNGSTLLTDSDDGDASTQTTLSHCLEASPREDSTDVTPAVVMRRRSDQLLELQLPTIDLADIG